MTDETGRDDRHEGEDGNRAGPGDPEGQDGSAGSDGGSESEKRRARERMSDGFARGMDMLSALKEAIETSISEARERGDLSVDRAREAMKDAVDRARDATSDAREKFDFVTRGEYEALVERVRALEEELKRDP